MSCSTSHLLKKNATYQIASVNNNTCKKLKDFVVVYVIFVDSKFTQPWTEYDMNSTLDSIKKAMTWVEGHAKNDSVFLDIQVVNHDNKNIFPIDNKLQKKTLSATFFGTKSHVNIATIDKWADKIAAEAQKSLGPDTSKHTKTKNVPKDRVSLIARLRDIYKTDNVALFYCLNNFFTDEISLALHTGENISIEYSILSFKETSVIAHEFLHLFGAIDLYHTPFESNRKMIRRKNFVMKEFPNEIMAFPFRNIYSLEISPLTKYTIGWENTLDQKYAEMIAGRKIKIASY